MGGRGKGMMKMEKRAMWCKVRGKERRNGHDGGVGTEGEKGRKRELK